MRPDHSPVERPELRLSVLIEAQPARVFGALTDSRELDDWSSGGVPAGEAVVDPRAGGRLSLGWATGPDRIVEVEQDRRMVLHSAPHDADGRVTLELEEKASGTAIYVLATGYRDSDTRRILDDRGRWSELLVCLKNHVEGGHAGFLNRYAAQVRSD